MNKKQYDYKKPNTIPKKPTLHDFPLKETSYQHYHPSQNINQHLRLTLQQLQQNKLTCDLQIQKRSLLQQQLKHLKNENEELKQQISELKRQLLKISKKYAKMKQRRQCLKCKQNVNINDKMQKQRQIYLNDRHILQQQINSLKIQLQNSQQLQQNEKLHMITDSLKKQHSNSLKKIEQQSKVIQFMNEKLSIFEKQNVQIMKNVQLLENKLSEIQIQSLLGKKNKKGCHVCDVRKVLVLENQGVKHSLKKRKRIGSIKNMRRENRDDDDSDQLEQYDI